MQQKQNYEGIDMPRVKKPTKVKEPVRLRTKKLADGSQSLYLDIYRFGKRTYEYLKLYLIPETDNNARRQNQATMNAANAIKSKRIIELTNGEAGIETKERVYLLDWIKSFENILYFCSCNHSFLITNF